MLFVRDFFTISRLTKEDRVAHLCAVSRRLTIISLAVWLEGISDIFDIIVMATKSNYTTGRKPDHSKKMQHDNAECF